MSPVDGNVGVDVMADWKFRSEHPLILAEDEDLRASILATT